MDEGKEVVKNRINPYENYRKVAEKHFGNITVSITTDGKDIPDDQAGRLIQNTNRAFNIATKINGGPIEDYEREIQISFPKEGFPGLMGDMDASRKLLEHDDDSQTATVIHEMVHGIEEEIPNHYENISQETLPLASEFVFGGDSRIPYFIYLTSEVIRGIKNKDDKKKLESHVIGWSEAIQLLSEEVGINIDMTNENAEEIINKLKNIKNIEESEKITIIKKFIEKSKKEVLNTVQ